MDGTYPAVWPDDGVPRPSDEFTDSANADSQHVLPHVAAHAGNSPGAEQVMLGEHRVTWVRISDLVNSGTGRMAGRGIDFEAELTRRLRHPAEVTRRAIRDRSASLPPLSAFGLRQSSQTRDSVSRR